jgi:hypothetical protein
MLRDGSATFRRALPAIALTFALLATTAVSAPSTSAVAPVARIKERIDETQRVELNGLVPRAVGQSVDLGPANQTLAVERLVMVLGSSPEQERAGARSSSVERSARSMTPSMRACTSIAGKASRILRTRRIQRFQKRCPRSCGDLPRCMTSAPATAGSQCAPSPDRLEALSVSALNFGADMVGSTTAAQTLLVSNTGGTSITLGSISITGAARADYADTGTCVAGLVLAPGASCFLRVTFDPSVAGSRSATLQIGSASLTLSGTGEPATGDGPLPPWSYVMMAALLLTISAIRLRTVPT